MENELRETLDLFEPGLDLAAGIDLLISPLPAHLSCSSFRNRIRKANTAVVRLSAARRRRRAHSCRREAFRLRSSQNGTN